MKPRDDNQYEYWRNLSMAQNNAGVACQDPEEKLTYYKEAMESRSQIPIQDRSPNDWRRLAITQNNAGLICHDPEEKLTCYKKAMESHSQIPTQDRLLDDWRCLAKYQFNASLECYNPEEKLNYSKKSMESRSQIPIQDRSLDDWRDLALCQFSAGFACHDPEEKLTYYKKSMESRSQIPLQNRSLDDLRHLAITQNNAGLVCHDPEEKLIYHKKAMESRSHIPLQDRSLDDLRDLAKYQSILGNHYRNQDDWNNAQKHFHACLEGKEIEGRVIHNVYENLKTMSLRNSLERELYHFGENIFHTDNHLSIKELKTNFFQLHLAILNKKNEPQLIYHLLKLMRLMEQYRTQPNFQNANAKTWLANEKDLKIFQQKLHELEQCYQPSSLIGILENSPNMMVALTAKLQGQETKIKELQERNQLLETMLQSQTNLYNNKMTTFGSTNNGRENPDTLENATEKKTLSLS